MIYIVNKTLVYIKIHEITYKIEKRLIKHKFFKNK